MNPGVVPPQQMVRFYTSAILLLYYGISLNSRSSALCHLGSTPVEEMLISAVMPIMSIYRLPQGQYGYSGHVINLPQDVASFFNSLPRLLSQLDVIIVKKRRYYQLRDFHVRRNVHRALQWLVMHNKYYRANNVCTDGNALDQLPEDGNLAQLRVIAIDFPTMDSLTSTASTCTSSSAAITSISPDDAILNCNSGLVDEPYDSYSAHLPQSFVPTAMQSMTEQEAVVKSVEEW